MNVGTVSPQELHNRKLGGQHVDLIDVRTPIEFSEAHVGFARNVPLDQLSPQSTSAASDSAAQPLYVICKAGGRGRQACEKLVAAGVTNVVNVEGGTQAWVQAGLPVVRARVVVSLERQVRIAAGALVLIGALLALFAHPFWMALPAFVGAGLVFSGITDTCGMGLMLAKMPWNRIRTDTDSTVAV